MWYHYVYMNTTDNKNKDFNTLADLVRIWGRKRGINNPDKQTLKLLEETGELASELCRGHYKTAEVKDALGDIEIVWIILVDILGYDITECLNEAYKVVEKRTGKTIDGSFVKDE